MVYVAACNLVKHNVQKALVKVMVYENAKSQNMKKAIVKLIVYVAWS